MSRPLRIKQDEYPYHITTKTNNGDFLLKNDEETRGIFLKVLRGAEKKYKVRVKHFVLMENHYHMILQTKGENIDRVMQYINSLVARLINKKEGRKGHLWGERYHATIIESEEYGLQAMRYIYNNPVRAKIVKRVEEYENSSYSFYAYGKDIGLELMGDEIYESLGKTEEQRRKNFIDFISEEIKEEEMLRIKKIHKDLFFGSDDFIIKMKEKYKKQLRIKK